MLGAFSYAFPVSWDYIPVFLVSLQRQNAFIMKKKYLWMLLAIFAIVCSVSVITYHNSKEDAPSVSPTDNSSEFVTLTDVVPDAILEIRYYGTYNFVGQRIDGYEEPTALLTKQAAKAMLAHGFKPLDSEWWHFTLKDEPFPNTYFTFPVRQLTN